MRRLGLSVKLNLLAGGVIIAVASAVATLAVYTIDHLTGRLNARLLQSEVSAILRDMDQARSVLVDSQVGSIPSYLKSTQGEFLMRLAEHRVGTTGRVYLVDGEGRLLLNPSDGSARDFASDDLLRIAAQPAGMLRAAVADKPSIVALGRFSHWDWNIAISMQEAEVNAERNDFLTKVLLIVLASVVAGGALFAWVAGRFVRPIVSLTREMSSITEDKLGVTPQYTSTSLEVFELQRSFGLMTSRLLAASVEKRRAEELIWRQANYDPLTDLPNRRMFNDRLKQAIKASKRSQRAGALMFLDLDHFKDVNDTLGHGQGDRLLVEASRRLAQCVRETDTLARLGGDEFTVILTEMGDPSAAERVARSILSALAQPFQLADGAAYVTASIGITLFPHDADDVDELLKNADQAMFVAKKEGRNCFRYFTRDLQLTAVTRMQTVNDLRRALDQGQLSVHYQPIVDLRDGSIHKAEALVRWNHPERGAVSPSEFIKLAEETGLIHVIGDWVFREAALQASRWRRSIHPGFQITVNTSPLQYLGERDATAGWLKVLDELSLPGSALALEITEGIVLHLDHEVSERLRRLRAAGLQVALDDFGTGYSSLSYLQRLAIDYLKIDKSFVRHLDMDPGDRALCEAIIVMSHKLGIAVVAEGVETEAQRAILEGAGCRYGQGFLFARPVPPAAFEQLLQGRMVDAATLER